MTKNQQEKTEKIQSLQEMIATAEQTILSAKKMLGQLQGGQQEIGSAYQDNSETSGEKVIYGKFNGQLMIGDDGKQYPVPANYASKSKLIEGDKLKLTITPEGSFVYKQIGPAERKYLIGIVKKDARGNYIINTEEKVYKVLLAAATYFKIELNDEITLVVPRNYPSEWGAIENIVRKGGEFSASATNWFDNNNSGTNSVGATLGKKTSFSSNDDSDFDFDSEDDEKEENKISFNNKKEEKETNEEDDDFDDDDFDFDDDDENEEDSVKKILNKKSSDDQQKETEGTDWRNNFYKEKSSNQNEANPQKDEEDDGRPLAIRILEKEIEEEKKRQAEKNKTGQTIVDEWTPNIEDLKREAAIKNKAASYAE